MRILVLVIQAQTKRYINIQNVFETEAWNEQKYPAVKCVTAQSTGF